MSKLLMHNLEDYKKGGSVENLRRTLEDEFFMNENKSATNRGFLLWKSISDSFDYHDMVYRKYRLFE